VREDCASGTLINAHTAVCALPFVNYIDSVLLFDGLFRADFSAPATLIAYNRFKPWLREKSEDANRRLLRIIDSEVCQRTDKLAGSAARTPCAVNRNRSFHNIFLAGEWILETRIISVLQGSVNPISRARVASKDGVGE